MGGCQGVPRGQVDIQGIPWGNRVGLMSLLMIHKAYMPVYSDPDFSCGTDGTDGTGRTDQPKVVQEVLADLKKYSKVFFKKNKKTFFFLDFAYVYALIFSISNGKICLFLL